MRKGAEDLFQRGNAQSLATEGMTAALVAPVVAGVQRLQLRHVQRIDASGALCRAIDSAVVMDDENAVSTAAHVHFQHLDTHADGMAESAYSALRPQ